MKNYIKYFLTKVKNIFKKIKIGKKCYIGKNVKISNTKNVILQNNVSIRPNVDIFCESIKIGNNVDIGVRNRIGGNVIIGNNVLFGPNNYIASNTHNYENVDVAIMFQGASNINKNNRGYLEIKDDSWIGTNCAIIGDIVIGKHCVIGANSVVTKDVPDYCVVAGNPAKIIKKYNFNTKKCEKV